MLFNELISYKLNNYLRKENHCEKHLHVSTIKQPQRNSTRNTQRNQKCPEAANDSSRL